MTTCASRRKFNSQTFSLMSGALFLPQSTLFAQTAKPVVKTVTRQPLSKVMANDARREQLFTLFERMRALPASNPSSYFFQAAIHWFPDFSDKDAGVQAIKAIFDADPKAKDALPYWNQCTHFGRGEPADFLVWHRAYVYHFEQSARNILGDSSFALPYWDYTSPQDGSRMLPDIFIGKQRQKEGKSIANSLFPIGGPDRTLKNKGDQLDPRAVNIDGAFNAERYFAVAGVPGFGGAVGQGGAVSAIDGVPHGAVHGGVGGWMGSVDTAAFDPVFWFHHANIDRLWNMWLAAKNKYWGAMPNGWLDQAPFSFMAPDGTIVREKRSFYADQANLGYRYDSDPTLLPQPTLGQPAGKKPPNLKSIQQLPREIKGFFEKPAGPATSGVTLSSSARTDVRVPLAPLPPPSGSTAPGNRPMALESVKEKYNYVVLDISGIEKESGSAGNYDIYASLPGVAPSELDKASRVGYLTTFEAPRRRPNVVPGKEVHQRVDITAFVQKLSSDKKVNPSEIVFTFVRSVGTDASGKPLDQPDGGPVHLRSLAVKVLVGSTDEVM